MTDLLRGALFTVAALAAAVVVSYGLNVLDVPLVPLIVNIALYFAIVSAIGFGAISQRWTFAAGAMLPVAAWAIASEGHARMLAADAPPAPAIAPVTTIPALTITGRQGLPVNASLTGGVSSLLPWDCAAWCRNLLMGHGVGAVVLEERPGPDAKGYRVYRISPGSTCDGEDGGQRGDPCLLSEPIANVPEGIWLRFKERADLPTAGSLCCVTLDIVAVEGGRERLIAREAPGNATTIAPLPIVFSGLSDRQGGRPLLAFMERDVTLGPEVTLNRAIAAVLGTPVDWSATRPPN